MRKQHHLFWDLYSRFSSKRLLRHSCMLCSKCSSLRSCSGLQCIIPHAHHMQNVSHVHVRAARALEPDTLHNLATLDIMPLPATGGSAPCSSRPAALHQHPAADQALAASQHAGLNAMAAATAPPPPPGPKSPGAHCVCARSDPMHGLPSRMVGSTGAL